MTPRRKRIVLIAGGLAALSLTTTLVMNALDSSIAFYFTPTQVAAGEAPRNKAFRIGGMVKEGSIHREADGLIVRFIVTDTAKEVPVAYKGILPDLFKEGKGAVVQGRIGDDSHFVASEVLAKHDENYMPPEAQHAIDAAQKAAGQAR